MSAARFPIRILCVDDHRIVREGITLILERQADLKVIASASTGEESLDLFRRYRPDITLMDLQLPRMSGLEAIQLIRADDPDARVVVLTMYDGDEDIYRALEAGAATYLLKSMVSDDLIRVVREVHAGGHPIESSVQARLAERVRQPTLTTRELEVMELMAEGLSNRQIADTLGISKETVQVHVKNIFAKLVVSDRIAAVRIARRRGMVHDV